LRSARHIALNILLKVEKDSAYVAPLLARAASELQPRDRRLLLELVYGTLRQRLALDYIISGVSRPPVSDIETTLLNILRAGTYQFLYMDRIPSHAIVHSSVELAKSFRGKKAAGFANAILRRIGKMEKAPQSLLPQEATPKALSIRTSHPLWLVNRWIRQFGYGETASICEANTLPPPATLRVNTSKLSRKEFIENAGLHPALKNARITPTKTALSGLTLSPLASLYETGWLKKGLVSIQDEASQIVGEIVNPHEGERILETCSGIGGKSSHLFELSDGKCKLVCCDNIPWKLKQIGPAVKRLGFPAPPCTAADMRYSLFSNPGIFDKVLVDAPCSNTGVLRRHPERKWHLTDADIQRMPALQTTLLDTAAGLVRKGGILVYSTCSIEREEGENIIENFLNNHPAFQPGRLPKRFLPFSRNHFFRSFPHRNGMDGFFCARLIRG